MPMYIDDNYMSTGEIMDSEHASKNFTIKELSCRCCNVFGCKPAFIEKLQEFRDLFGKPLTITSAYRCSKHNAEVGGHPKSEHVEGVAADIVCTTSEDRFRMVEIAMSLGFHGIGEAKSYIHVDYRLGRKSKWLYP